jgi:predicted N-acyltransferase
MRRVACLHTPSRGRGPTPSGPGALAPAREGIRGPQTHSQGVQACGQVVDSACKCLSRRRIVALHKKQAASSAATPPSSMTQPDGFRLFPAIARIDARQWDALVDASAASAAPCVRHAFLRALEESGCVGGRSGWTATHATLWRDGSLCAAMPLYLKAHSWGEYVFDWAWAEAYQRHGLDYFPKWLGAVPFTPIPGPRLLGRDDGARRELLAALLGQARESGLSSLHLLFPLDNERALLEAAGLMIREGVQFHWENPPASANEPASPGAGAACSVPPRRWAGFEDFLASLAGSKRKKIRQERRRAAAHGLHLQWLDGHEARDEDWAFFAHCYATTYALHRSTPYLSADFFLRLAHSMPEAVRLLVARRDGPPGRRSVLPVRSRGAVWALLGLHRGPTLRPLRVVLLPGHRVLPRARAGALRRRRPGRAQARPRPAPGAHLLRALARGCALSRRGGRLAGEGARGRESLPGRTRRAQPVPPRQGCRWQCRNGADCRR